MSPLAETLIADLSTILLSIIASTFLAGAKWGAIQQRLKNIEDRLGMIENMFKLTLKDD